MHGEHGDFTMHREHGDEASCDHRYHHFTNTLPLVAGCLTLQIRLGGQGYVLRSTPHYKDPYVHTYTGMQILQ